MDGDGNLMANLNCLQQRVSASILLKGLGYSSQLNTSDTLLKTRLLCGIRDKAARPLISLIIPHHYRPVNLKVELL
jgi:hypothetical protein